MTIVEDKTPPIVSRSEWTKAREELLKEEKAHTRAGDVIAEKRRFLPREKVTKDYDFIAPDGHKKLKDLFEGRRQLIVYHHMLKPQDTAPCSGCCMIADNLTHLAHLHARDTTLAMVSRAPIAEIEAFKKRMGWDFPWWETTDDFNEDFDVPEYYGLNVFLREGDDILRTYFMGQRGVEALGSVWSLLDLTPLGRQEGWQNAPPGTPQGKGGAWWRLHDEY